MPGGRVNMHWFLKLRRCLSASSAILAAIGLASCASLPNDPAARAEVERLNDPIEPINREVYAANKEMRQVLLPLQMIASAGSPVAPLAAAVHNVLVNLREPLTFANDLAQGKECAAGASLRRFMVNSTLGVGGIFDVAKDYGVAAHDNDIGQTLGVWGIPAGPYLMLPVLGPSDVRGAAGTAAEYVVDPVSLGLSRAGWTAAVWPIAGLDALDRSLEAAPDLDKLDRTSLDGYAALRSAYRQNQTEALNDDKCPDVLRIGGEGIPATRSN